MGDSKSRDAYQYAELIRARFPRLLQQAREAQGLTKYGLARESGISREHIARLERGETTPTIALAAQLSRGLRMTFAEFAARMEGRDADLDPPAKDRPGNVPHV